MMKLLKAAAALSVIGFSLAALGAAPNEARVVQELRNATSEAAMDQVIADFNQSRVNLINDLVRLLREAPSAEKKGRVCFVLGEVDNGRSVRPLIENLLVEVSVDEASTRRPLWGKFPCQDALAKMGKPAEFQLIDILSNSESESVRAGAFDVLRKIEGWRGTIFVLEQAVDGAEIGQRGRLEKALEKARKEVPPPKTSATQR
jgi:HEAT repeat protein